VFKFKNIIAAFGVAALVTGLTSVGSVAQAATPTAPDAPVSLAATPGNTTVLLTWTAPANGGSPITGYNLYKGNSSGGESSTPLNGSTLISDNTMSVTSLTNGHTYYFTAKAVNSVGSSVASNEVWAIPAATVPLAPTGVVAVPGNASATVNWAAPSSPGGSAITRYTVTAADSTALSRGSQTCAWTSGALSCTVGGLTNGDSYTFSVTATNSTGTGVASSTSSAVVPAITMPSVPVGLAATPGNASVQLSWTTPSNGGAAITGYNLYKGTSAGGENYGAPVNGATLMSGTTVTVTGLTNAQSYYFTLKAVNPVGSSLASSEVWAIPAGTVPSAPSGVSASPGNASATVTWVAPNPGGAIVTRYAVSAADATSSARGGQSCTTTGMLSCIVTGLTNGDSYAFSVTATNSVGTSAASPA